jgi:hypothetical protein
MSHATGSVPGTRVMIAFMVPVWFAMAGWYSYMKVQITPAATAEIAIGKNSAALTSAPYLSRSARTAMSRPTSADSDGSRTTQRAVFFSAILVTGSLSVVA